MLERIDEHAEDIGETRSVAARKLLADGLDADERPGFQMTLPAYFAMMGLMMVSAAYFEAEPITGHAGLAIVLAVPVLTTDRAQSAMDSIRERIR